MKIEVKKCPQHNFGNNKYMAIVDGEVVANGQTRKECMERAIAALKGAWDLLFYPQAVKRLIDGAYVGH